MDFFNYPEDTILDINSKTKKSKYDSKIRFYQNKHLGQLKLFSNELQFILDYVCDVNVLKNKKILLYIGAGPGNHLVYLCKMFPFIEFHLYDDHFDDRLKKVENIKLFYKYFDDKLASDYYNLQNDNPNIDLYFVSDIRDLTYDSRNWNLQEELKVINDMRIQSKWVYDTKAKYSMIKFRLPFPEPEVIEYLGSSKVDYLKGVIYKQPWARGKSIETRLIIDKKDNFIEIPYDIKDYEETLFYHNSVDRQKKIKYSMMKTFNGKVINEFLTLKDTFDSATIVTLLLDYLDKIYSEPLSKEKKDKKITYILDKISRGKYFENDE